jgi:hypothetical protein
LKSQHKDYYFIYLTRQGFGLLVYPTKVLMHKALDFTGQFVKTLQSFSFPMSLSGILALNVEDRGLVSPVGSNNRL